jgi:hypothetical protein
VQTLAWVELDGQNPTNHPVSLARVFSNPFSMMPVQTNAGSITERTTCTESAGNCPSRACSRIVASSGAI